MNHITKPRLDMKRIRDSASQLAESINQRFPISAASPNHQGGAERVQSLLSGFDKRRDLQLTINRLNQLRNAHQLDDASRSELAQAKLAHEQADAHFNSLAVKFPNFTHPRVPIGDMSNARLVRQTTATTTPPAASAAFPLKTHLQLGAALDLLDFESAAKTSGSKFVFMKNELAVLHTALELLAVRFFSQQKFAFRPMTTPELVRPWVLESCGFAPRSGEEEDQVYRIPAQDLCLIGTSEIALAGYLSSTTHMQEQRLLGVSHCYRTEAGSGGKHSKGLYRLHQFSKVEMFVCCSPWDSEQRHLDMLDASCAFLDELHLPYRVLDMPTEELGASAYRKYDIEVYMPASKRWGEVASLTNCIDYQARRLEIKFKNGDFAHTLNGTACALPRILLALLEINQQPDGSVTLPACLHALAGFDKIELKKKQK